MATKTEKKLVDLTEDVLDAIATYGVDLAWKDGMVVATHADDNPPGSRLVAVDDNGHPIVNGVNKKLVELQNLLQLVRATTIRRTKKEREAEQDALAKVFGFTRTRDANGKKLKAVAGG